MAEPLVIQKLKQKRAEISGVIAAYRAKITAAKHDLVHINAAIRLFEGGEQERAPVHRRPRLLQEGRDRGDLLGHRDPSHTVQTRVAGRQFEGLWK
jgi:hypothetical protein